MRFQNFCETNINFEKGVSNIAQKSFYFRYADQLTVDDEVLVQGNYDLIPAKVTNISNVMTKGVRL